MKFMKLGSKPDCFQTNGNGGRFVASELATDIVVNVGGVRFHLHKFPLLSKSSRMQRLVAINNHDEDEIQISDMPGSAAAFEICAKFCYGMTVTLNAYNVMAARCAAEYLEMHESTEKGNLIYKIDAFLSISIFHSWKDSMIALQTTKWLSPWAEDLKLVGHCIDSIACKASVDASKVDWSYTYNQKKLLSENRIDTVQSVPGDWWVEDLCEIDQLELYKRVIAAIKAKGCTSDKVIGEALRVYTYKKFRVFSKGSVTEKGDNMKSCVLLETIVRLLPEAKGSVSCSFLTMLLKAASLLDCSEACKRELIRRIGWQLDEASVSEICMHDIDTVMLIVEEFVSLQDKSESKNIVKITEDLLEIEITPVLVPDVAKMNVTKLVDGYLTETAKDESLPLSKFLDLAEMVSGDSRPVHDELYNAIDVYLKEHLSLTKSERKKLCSLVDCRKLSADACAHAVQNDRLPLRMVVQILFYEQARASTATGHDNGSSGTYGSLRSAATTNTTDDSLTVQDTDSLKSMKLESTCTDEKGNGQVRVMPGKFLGKYLPSKGNGVGDNCGSDASIEDPKSTPMRRFRQSLSRF